MRLRPVGAVAVAVGAAVVVAVIMRPRSGVIDPAAVAATDYFSATQLDRADDFRGPQRLLFLAGLLVQGATLAFLALRARREAFDRFARRPLLGAAAAGALVSLALALATLPLAIVGHARSADVGLSTQTWSEWAFDVVRSDAIGAAMAGFLAVLFVALVRRFPRRWWIPGAAAVVAVGVVITYAAPVVLDPIFNDFEEIPADSRARQDVEELADRARVDVGEILKIDASRRTTGLNAYVGGLGSTKRVVLYDNLLRGLPRPERRSVIAHELAHVHFSDVPRGLLYLAIIAPFATWAVASVARAVAPPGTRASGATVPALALALAIVATPVTWASNGLSRQVEARADSYALRLTDDASGLIGLQRRLSISNVSQPDPPGWSSLLFGTHPTTVERIGAAEEFRKGRPARAPSPGGS